MRRRTACRANSASTRSSSTCMRATCVVRRRVDYHAWLEGKLPRYMVPRFIEVHPGELPETPSQKVQKFKLAEANVDGPEVIEFAPARR